MYIQIMKVNCIDHHVSFILHAANTNDTVFKDTVRFYNYSICSLV